MLLGLDPGAAQPGETCALSALAAASDRPLPAGFTPLSARYPLIRWQADLFHGDGADGALTCSTHRLAALPQDCVSMAT